MDKARFIFILKSLWYYKKQHLSVFASIVLSTTILTGALVLGDSVRLSLLTLVEQRLGKTTYVLNTGTRFVRAKLADEISGKIKSPVAALMKVNGIAVNQNLTGRRYSVNVLGVDSSFRQFVKSKFKTLNYDEAIINENVASNLNLKPGDEFLLRVEKTGFIPLNTPLVNSDNQSIALYLKVKSIAPDSGYGRFSLKTNQSPPFNVFVSLKYLTDKLELAGRANLLLFSGESSPEELNDALCKCIQIDDLGLSIRKATKPYNLELISNRIFIDKKICGAIDGLPLKHQNIETYFVNKISFKGNETPYSFVCAAEYPFLPARLKDFEIIVNDWLASDLKITPGDTVLLDYSTIGPLHTLKENNRKFVVKSIVKTDNNIEDRTLMPAIPGFSDAITCNQWNPGIPVNTKKIRKKDEKYWDRYRGTPKAFINLTTGCSIWNNPLGSYTSVRFDEKLKISADSLNKLILKHINPGDAGMLITPVRTNGITAASNSIDFGELFLYLSFFVIAAAVILIAITFSLATNARTQETGILAGLGFTRKQTIYLRFAESFVVILAGGITGTFIGILYNKLLIIGLDSIWNEAVRTHMIKVHVLPDKLLIGAKIGIVIAILTILTVTIQKLKHPVALLVKAETNSYIFTSRKSYSVILAFTSIVIALILVFISLLTRSYNNAGMFLTAGGLFLFGSSYLTIYFNSGNRKPNHSVFGIFQLALKNAGRNKSRSFAIIFILALGTFVVILTGSYRKTYYGAENLNHSGTGGFLLWAETTLPVTYNLNEKDGRNKLLIYNEHDLDSVHFIQLRGVDGDDASCLNLNQVNHPALLGIDPGYLDKKGSFSFTKISDNSYSEHPWKITEKNKSNKTITAFADETVIQYGLHKKVGDTVTYMDEFGENIYLKLCGGLDNSIFQGYILIPDSDLIKHFPSAGSKVFLTEAPATKIKIISSILNSSLPDFGVNITSANERLAAFNSVENAYLSVFMALGGLGLLIGTIGLGIIIYSNMLQRRHEISMLKSIGFPKNQILIIILIENISLFVAGIMCGTASALIGILPSILSPDFNIQGWYLSVIIAAVILTGIIWIYIITKSFFKGDLIKLLNQTIIS